MDFLYSDLVGPIPVKGYNGARFFIYLHYNATKFSAVKCIKSKAKAAKFIIWFIKANK